MWPAKPSTVLRLTAFFLFFLRHCSISNMFSFHFIIFRLSAPLICTFVQVDERVAFTTVDEQRPFTASSSSPMLLQRIRYAFVVVVERLATPYRFYMKAKPTKRKKYVRRRDQRHSFSATSFKQGTAEKN